MPLFPLKSPTAILLCVLGAIVALYVLYLFNLSGMGMVGPDEPRYASIGRDMARSGDWITPRLWGTPWFEKPALLYWMTAAAFRVGLSQDLAPRLPGALISVAFLVFYFWILRSEFNVRAACYASAILATSGGWLMYSHIGVPDIPLAASYSSAMLLTLPWISEKREPRYLTAAGALLGIAVLAKGLAPIVLAIPLLWFARDRLRNTPIWKPALAFLIVALPWYTLCTYRNGGEFLRTFFWRHQIERFTSASLQHVQPFWFYVPRLPALMFPWTPVMAGLLRHDLYRDRRAQFLIACAAFGFIFFSASTNKLPGYVLPLIPLLAALMGISLAEMQKAGPLLFGATALLSLTPVIALMIPWSLSVWPVGSDGSMTLDPLGVLVLLRATAIPFALAGALAWRLDAVKHREAAMLLVVILVVLSFTYLNVHTPPEIERVASARLLWREVTIPRESLCAGGMHRNWHYGLNYYSIIPLPDCEAVRKPFSLAQEGSRPVIHPAR